MDKGFYSKRVCQDCYLGDYIFQAMQTIKQSSALPDYLKENIECYFKSSFFPFLITMPL